MATPLMWKALALSQNVYNRLSYRYIFSTDANTLKFAVEKNKLKLLPLYCSFPLFAILCILCLKIVVKFLFNPTSMPLDGLVFTLAVGIATVSFPVLNYICILFADEFTQSLNMLFKFHREFDGLFEKLIKVRDMNLTHSHLLIREIKKLFMGDRHADVLGILINILVGVQLSFGIVLAPLTIIYGYDPLTLSTLETAFKPAGTYAFVVFKCAIIQWCVLEGARINSIILVLTMAVLNTFIKCIRKIKLQPPGINAVFQYQQLHYILKVGCQPIKCISGVLMLAGPLILIVCNIIAIKLSNVLPTELYLIFVILSGIIYTVIYQCVPVAAKCHELSKQLLRQHWWGKSKFEVQILTSVEFQIWRKQLRAQEPLIFYYGIAVFESSTKTNLYENIADYTVNISLLVG